MRVSLTLLNNLVNTGQRIEQEKDTQILMKDNEQKTVHSFFIKTILKEQWDLLENKNKIEQSRLKSIREIFYPSLENRNILELTNKYQKITYLQGEV